MKLSIVSVLVFVSLDLLGLLSNRHVEESKALLTPQPDSSNYISDSTKETTFEFSNGKSICLSGWMEIEDEREIYSEFNLRDCDTGEVLVERWAREECELSLSNDTLWVSQLDSFALGEGNTFVKFPWKIGILYYGDDGVEYSEWFNDNIRYDQHTIELVLMEYKTTEWRTQLEGNDYVNSIRMKLANKLMISAISGSQKSEEYFKEFRIRFKPDGWFAQWYKEMGQMLEYAKVNKRVNQ